MSKGELIETRSRRSNDSIGYESAIKMPDERSYSLQLFGADGTETTQRARENLSRILRSNNLNENCYEFIDVLVDPIRTLSEGIFVTPTLVIMVAGKRNVIVGALDEAASVNALLSRLPSAEG